jgi:proteasome lid subunit RPN8/RPN11
MIRIDVSLLRQMYGHAEASYPNECCGVIIGRMDPGNSKTVHAVRACKNLNRERARDRYDMDPLDLMRADQEFEHTPWSIVGIYHSHPDHPSRPSETDRERAAPLAPFFQNYSYLIMSVQKGTVAMAQSWVLDPATEKFDEEPLITEGDSK